jgi:hypothetical protein
MVFNSCIRQYAFKAEESSKIFRSVSPGQWSVTLGHGVRVVQSAAEYLLFADTAVQNKRVYCRSLGSLLLYVKTELCYQVEGNSEIVTLLGVWLPLIGRRIGFYLSRIIQNNTEKRLHA